MHTNDNIPIFHVFIVRSPLVDKRLPNVRRPERADRKIFGDESGDER